MPRFWQGTSAGGAAGLSTTTGSTGSTAFGSSTATGSIGSAALGSSTMTCSTGSAAFGSSTTSASPTSAISSRIFYYTSIFCMKLRLKSFKFITHTYVAKRKFICESEKEVVYLRRVCLLSLGRLPSRARLVRPLPLRDFVDSVRRPHWS